MPLPKKYARVLIKNPFYNIETPVVKENIAIVNVFSINNKGGNPCAVVDNAGKLSTEEMQGIATRLKYPETVFIIRNKYQYVLRFFATKREIPLCYHGLLGAAFYLHKLHSLNLINLEAYIASCYTNAIRMNVKCKDDLASISIPNKVKIIDSRIDIEIISKLLGLSKYFIDKNLPCLVASVGNPKLLIPINNRASLFSINPDLDLISQWCKEHKVNGIYAYSIDTEHSDSDYVGRNFNPLFSHQEDIATGTAAAALCQMLFLRYGPVKNTFTIEQGANLNSPSKIYVSVTEETIKIKGHAYFPKNKNNNAGKTHATSEI